MRSFQFHGQYTAGYKSESPIPEDGDTPQVCNCCFVRRLLAGATSVFTAATKPFRLRADTASGENAPCGKTITFS